MHKCLFGFIYFKIIYLYSLLAAFRTNIPLLQTINGPNGISIRWVI